MFDDPSTFTDLIRTFSGLAGSFDNLRRGYGSRDYRSNAEDIQDAFAGSILWTSRPE